MKRFISFILIAISVLSCFADDIVLSGYITDSGNGLPIESVSVTFKILGKQYATMTDSLGLYKISIPAKARFVEKVSHVGYRPKSKFIVANRENIIQDFDLESKDNTLRVCLLFKCVNN